MQYSFLSPYLLYFSTVLKPNFVEFLLNCSDFNSKTLLELRPLFHHIGLKFLFFPKQFIASVV